MIQSRLKFLNLRTLRFFSQSEQFFLNEPSRWSTQETKLQDLSEIDPESAKNCFKILDERVKAFKKPAKDFGDQEMLTLLVANLIRDFNHLVNFHIDFRKERREKISEVTDYTKTVLEYMDVYGRLDEYTLQFYEKTLDLNPDYNNLSPEAIEVYRHFTSLRMIFYPSLVENPSHAKLQEILEVLNPEVAEKNFDLSQTGLNLNEMQKSIVNRIRLEDEISATYGWEYEDMVKAEISETEDMSDLETLFISKFDEFCEGLTLMDKGAKSSAQKD